MFAYCTNNPVKRSDPKGYAYKGINSQINYNEHDHTYGGLRENFYAKTSQDYVQPTGTLTIGLGYVGTAGKGGAVTIGLIFDYHGNIGLMQTTYVGGGIPTAGYFVFATISNAPTIYAQQGWAGQTGVSGTILGYEYSLFSDATSNTSYHGHTFSAGFTPNALPIEIHGGASYSWLLWDTN